MSKPSIISWLCTPVACMAQCWLARIGLLALLLFVAACGPPGPDWIELMKTPTPPRRTPTPPAITPVPGPGGMGHVTWVNQEKGVLVSFYLQRGQTNDAVSDGFAHLQISKKRDADGCVQHPPDSGPEGPIPGTVAQTECLLLDVKERVEPADYALEYKQYLDRDLKQWRGDWHYWYTFPLVSFDDALEEVGSETVLVMVWFENEDGAVYGRWLEPAKHEAGRLSPPIVPAAY
jgi:hypothetical protein